ncbi:MAG TPA: hypothetical protein VG015_02890, partial [Candidatus Dormibacteraeota bacterium]|nr:hypothetical protein [Candidatus Dormibacteraeota bacterium]
MYQESQVGAAPTSSQTPPGPASAPVVNPTEGLPSPTPVAVNQVPSYNYRLERIIWFAIGFVDVLIALRFAFHVLG